MIDFDPSELQRISELSQTEEFSLWYDPISNRFFREEEAPETARWIADLDEEYDSEAIREITQLVMDDMESDQE